MSTFPPRCVNLCVNFMPLHLRKRGGLWHYSRTVPEDVRALIGRPYWRFTLATGNVREAEAQRSKFDAEYDTLIEEMRDLTNAQKLSRIRLESGKAKSKRPKFDPRVIKHNGFVVSRATLPIPEEPRWGLSELGDARPEVKSAYVGIETQQLRRASALLKNLSTREKRDIETSGGLEKFYRTTRQTRLYENRAASVESEPTSEEHAVRREVKSQLLARREETLEKLGLHSPTVLDDPESPDNPRLKTALENWLTENKQKPPTVVKYRLHIRRLTEFAGNITVKALSGEIVEKFVKAYADLPNARALTLAQRPLPMPQLLALRRLNPDLPAMGGVNVRKMVEYLRAFLRAIKREDLRALVRKPKDDRSHAERTDGYPPIRPNQMRLLLPAVDHEFGRDSDMVWWIWLLAYSGMRPEEAAQLGRANIAQIGPIWAIEINDHDLRKIKNAQSLRTIPVHPKLVERGFIEFARPKGDDQGLVFKSFDYDDKGGRSNNPSRRLKRLLNKLHIEGRGSGHRFRPSFIDAIRNAELPYSIEIGLVGHTDKNRNHGRYGYGITLKTMARVIQKIDPSID